MICHFRSWALPAAFVTAALALTACSGSSSSPVPLAPGQIAPGGFYDSGAQLHAMTTSGGALAAACPKTYLQCFKVSLKKGLVIDWCDGTSSKMPCTTTKNYTWSGNVCLAKSKTCNPIEQLTAAWTGPFPCKSHPKACGGYKVGYYEVDTISVGKTPPKQTKKYLYKQQILLSGTLAATIGLNVGP